MSAHPVSRRAVASARKRRREQLAQPASVPASQVLALAPEVIDRVRGTYRDARSYGLTHRQAVRRASRWHRVRIGQVKPLVADLRADFDAVRNCAAAPRRADRAAIHHQSGGLK